MGREGDKNTILTGLENSISHSYQTPEEKREQLAIRRKKESSQDKRKRKAVEQKGRKNVGRKRHRYSEGREK